MNHPVNTKNKIDTMLFNNDEDYVLCVLINDELKMDYGKIMNFCCQSIYKVIKLNESFTCNNDGYLKWVNSEKFIILKAKEEDLLYCVNTYSNTSDNIWCQNILDLGKPEISAFSLVCVAFTPIIIKDIPQFMKYLKEL